jgi:beta-glucosidase
MDQREAQDSEPDARLQQRVEELLAQLTLIEKFSLCAGEGFWKTRAIPRLGIRRMKVTDGPRGVAWHSSGKRSTAFPSGISLGASWNTDLARECGAAMGLEAKAADCQMLLGPAVNICRTPLNGRTFEYLTEDPCLNSRLAVALVKGIQSRGVAACIKHYAANNQETERMKHSVNVSQRALREIYLPAFEATAREADAWGLMAAYNAVNGTAACEHRELLHDNLREEFGFRGLVVSDWFAVRRTTGSAPCIKAGLTLEMPGKGSRYKLSALHAAFQAGEFSEAELDSNLRWLLRVMIRTGCVEGETAPLPAIDTTSHRLLARRAAEEGMVLLRNEGALLPIDPLKVRRIAIVGPKSRKRNCLPLWGGSSGVWARGEITPYQGVSERLTREGLTRVTRPEDADLVILCLGLSHRPGMDSEIRDRKSLELPAQQLRLLARTVQRNPNTVVVLINGSPVSMDWAERVPAILEAWYPGVEGGHAIARILFGDTSPGGKLPVTFPRRLSDSAAHRSSRSYPGENLETWYDEDVFVGYRHMDRENLEPLFPFGHGLSYTSFEYHNLQLSHSCVEPGSDLEVTAEVRNCGPVAGAEVVQLYLRDVEASVPRPEKELKGFRKIYLQPGETATVHFQLGHRDMAYYSEVLHTWQVEEGLFEVMLAASSRDVRLRAVFEYHGRDAVT